MVLGASLQRWLVGAGYVLPTTPLGTNLRLPYSEEKG
jgi:hypothetical protein